MDKPAVTTRRLTVAERFPKMGDQVRSPGGYLFRIGGRYTIKRDGGKVQITSIEGSRCFHGKPSQLTYVSRDDAGDVAVAI